MIERISPPGAPAPRGPYSPAVRAGDCVYVAGQVSIDPISGKVVSGVVRSLDYIVVGEDPGSKLAKARAQGTPELDETALLALLQSAP